MIYFVHKPLLILRPHLSNCLYKTVDVSQQISCFLTKQTIRQAGVEERVDRCFILNRRMRRRAFNFPDHGER